MSRKTTALIVDDEQEARDLLAGLMQKFPDIEIVAQAPCVETGIIYFLKYKPDIVFLDIQMPQKDGFAFVEHLKDYLSETTVIFVTAYHQYAIDAIKHSAFDFLLKPVNQKELKETLERYRESKRNGYLHKNIQDLLLQLNGKKKIKFVTRLGFELVMPDNIIYLGADGRYTKLFCLDDKTIHATIILKEIEERLNGFGNFLRINRSTIINTKYLSSFDRTHKKCSLYVESKNYTFSISRDRLKYFEEVI